MPPIIEKVVKISTTPFVITLPISFLIILFLPDIFDKYIVESSGKQPEEIEKYYVDLDSDGNSEEVRLYIHSFGVLSNGKMIAVEFFKGTLAEVCYIQFGDIDFDGIKEILIFTHKNGEIFINCYNAFTNKFLCKNRKIFQYNLYQGLPDYIIDFCGLYDTDNDRVNEVYLAITGALKENPRTFLSFDIKNDRLHHMPKVGQSISFPFAFDIDNDGINEFFGNSIAGKDTTLKSEDDEVQVWLMALTPKMEFKFKPVKIGAFYSSLQLAPFRSTNKRYLAALHIYFGKNNIPSFFAFYDKNGNQVKKSEFVFNGTFNYFLSVKDKLYLLNSEGHIQQLDSELNIVPITKIPNLDIWKKPFQYDLDNDGEKELVFLGKERTKLIITKHNITEPVYIELGFRFNPERLYSIIEKKGEYPRLFVQNKRYYCSISYKKNPLYYFQIIVYISIYGVILLFVIGIMRVQKYRLEKKYNAEKKIANLQLKSLKNRLDPHFTLNLINSIGSLVHKKDHEKATYVFSKYATLLRNTILSSDNITVPLKEEIEFVKNYLDLESFRYDNKFRYEIRIEKDVDVNLLVPKMQIHLFVENALNHGIKHKKDNGHIIILAESIDKNCIIEIIDNGIGRKNAEKYSSTNTGKGLKMLDEILALYAQLKKVFIKYEIIDLYDVNNNPSGTKVSIKIPLN